jgi:hypothetical protein
MANIDKITLNGIDYAIVDSTSGYAKYVLCQDEAAYNAITNKDSSTLYLIPESNA